MPPNDDLRRLVEALRALLVADDEAHFRRDVDSALAGERESFERFVTSNELWVGAGSIADQAGWAIRDDRRRKIEAALVELGHRANQTRNRESPNSRMAQCV